MRKTPWGWTLTPDGHSVLPFLEGLFRIGQLDSEGPQPRRVMAVMQVACAERRPVSSRTGGIETAALQSQCRGTLPSRPEAAPRRPICSTMCGGDRWLTGRVRLPPIRGTIS